MKIYGVLRARLCRAKDDFDANKSAESGQKLPHSISEGRRSPKVLVAGGFSLIELMVVVVILGIVATIGANLIGARDKAFLAVMKADLKNLATEQALYVVDNYMYANSLADLRATSSEGIILELLGETAGFSARTTHPGLPDARCAIFLGTVSSVFSPATAEGAVTCDGVGAGGGGAGKGKGADGDSCGQGVPKSQAKAQGQAC